MNLINKEEIIKFCITSKNFDKALIKDAIIEVVQDNYFRPLIGDDLYNEIITQSAVDVQNLSENNAALVEQFKPALAYNIVLLCIPTIMMNITSSGVMINNTDYSQSGTDKQRADVAETLREIGRMQKEKFMRWLKINKDTYPLFSNWLVKVTSNCRRELWNSDFFYFIDDLNNDNSTNSSIIGGILL